MKTNIINNKFKDYYIDDYADFIEDSLTYSGTRVKHSGGCGKYTGKGVRTKITKITKNKIK